MPKRSQSRNRKCTTLISNTVIVSDTDSDTDNESAVRISFSTSGSQCMVIIINGVVPLRGFPVGRRGIGCRVPILGSRRLAGLVRLVGRARPSRCCQAGMAVQLVGPAPTPHGRQKVVRRCGGLLSIRPPGDAM